MPCDPAIPVLGIHPDKTIIWKDTCIVRFRAALFTRPGNSLDVHQQMNGYRRCGVYTYTHKHTCNGILFSHIKNEIMPFATTWMDLEIIILSEVSQKEKDKYHMIPHIHGI